MYNAKIFKKHFGFYNQKKGYMSIKDALTKIERKMEQISVALEIDKDLIFNFDGNGIPFVGCTPSVLYDKDASVLKNITPVVVPVTFFVTGDAFETNNLSNNKWFGKYKNFGMPRSHKFAQSLICKSIIDNPIYLKGKPLVPIGIDNYIFASPKEVLRRFKVLQAYKEALDKKVPINKITGFKKIVDYAFDAKYKDTFQMNLILLREFSRIFPNSLKTTFTDEPPTAATRLGKFFSYDDSLAVVQTNFAIHPSFIDIKDNYYLYFNPNFNGKKDEYMKVSKKSFMVPFLPVSESLLRIKRPSIGKKERIILSVGGVAGRLKRIIGDLSNISTNFPLEYLVLTSVPKNSIYYEKILRVCLQKSNSNAKFIPIPKVDIKRIAELYNQSHATLGLPGTYTALGCLASGRPFGAIIDIRKSVDKIFTDHFVSNAYYLKNYLKYPTVIIDKKVKKEDIVKLVSEDFAKEAYKNATGSGGTREMFKKANQNWRDVFIYFLK